MSEASVLAEIEQLLAELEAISFVAHRDTRANLPSILPYGADTALAWARACKALFEHDRDAGKAFIRGSAAAAAASAAVRPWTDQALRFLKWRGSWEALQALMDQLPAAYACLGPQGEARWVGLGLDWCERHLQSGIAYFKTPVAALAGAEGVPGIEALLAPAETLFHERRVALGTYLPGAIKARDLLGPAALAGWARRGADIMQAGRLRGEAYFRLESEESLALLLENLPGYSLPEHQRLLALVLAAWFEEDFELRAGRWSAEQPRGFVETDGVRLYLPPVMPAREQAILAVIHTAGHLAFDSYERRHLEALFARAGRSHPPLDEEQRITWRPLFADYGEDLARFQLIFDLCEDLRVDWRIQQRVPNHLARLLRLAEAQAPPPGPAGAYYAAAIETVRGSLGLAPLDARLAPLLRPQATVVEAYEIACELYREGRLPAIGLEERAACFLPGRSPNAARPVFPRRRLDPAEDHDLDRDEAATQRPEPAPRPDEKRDLPQGAEGDDPDLEIPPEDTSGSGGRVGVGIPQPAAVEGAGQGPRHHEQGRTYPEWDYREGRYKRDWAYVQEKPLIEGDAEEAGRLMAQHAALLKRIKRALQSQRPTRPAPRRRQWDGEELDLEATVGFVAERRAGMSPVPLIYRRREMQQRDTAVMLLADISTSIMQSAHDGPGRVVDHLRAGMLLFAESLEEVGDPCAIAAFASKNRDNVSYYPIKEFHQTLGPETRAVLGGLSGRLATRMGAAIRHASARFQEATSRRRLLLILSDGRPADYDDGGDEQYLHEDTRMAVKEAVDQGVHPFCLTLDPRGSQYLTQIFGPGHYLVLDHINDLPRKLPEVYLRLRH